MTQSLNTPRTARTANDDTLTPGAIERYAETQLPTEHGTLRTVVYRDAAGVEHLALVVGDVAGEDVLCRVHSECLTGEVLGSLKCDCRQQLDAAIAQIVRRGRGVVLYLRQEGRGIGLGNKIRAYALQERGLDTLDANRALGLPDDARDYTVATQMLADLGVRSVALLTNNPLKVEGLESAGVRVSRRVPHLVEVGPIARRYVAAKGARMGHVVDARFVAGVQRFVDGPPRFADGLPQGTRFRPAADDASVFAK